MKTFALAGLLAAGLATGPAFGKTFDLPDANPAVTVSIPDAWKPSEVDKGVEGTSPDGETYVAFETATAKGMEALIDDDIKFLTKQGVIIDRKTQQMSETKMNGIPVSLLSWKGKDKDGPTTVTLGLFGVTDNLILLMTAWSSPDGDKANGAALTEMLGAVKRR